MALLSIFPDPDPDPDPDLGPTQAVARALLALQPGLEPEHVRVVSVHCPPGVGVAVWRWELAPSAPTIEDPRVTVVPGLQEDGRWRPTAAPAAETLARGIALQIDIGWVVAAAQSDDETATELLEQALAHVAAIEGE